MSTAARWLLRLPRTTSRGAAGRTWRSAVRKHEQRRWVQRPPPAPRPWASRSPRDRQDEMQDRGRFEEARTKDKVPREQPSEPPGEQQVGRNTQLATTLAESNNSDLVAEVHIPDDPHGIIPHNHPALAILGNSSLVIQRQIEMMNVMLGFEQANRYIIMDGQGQTLGYIAEQDHGIGSAMARQVFRTHRSFTTHIFDAQEREVLRIHRPFAYINSRIRIYDPVPEGGYSGTETSTALQGTSASSATNQGAVAQVSPLKLDEMRIIGEAQQQWAPLRRKYNLFTYRPIEPPQEDESTPRITSGDVPASDTTALTESTTPDRAIEAGMSQFAHVNEPFLSWDFTLKSEQHETIGSVNRNFGGFAREIFTDTGVYALRMDSAAQSSTLEDSEGKEVGRYERDATAMTLDQRAVMLATAVSIDFDYFSRHSHAGGHGFMPFFWPMGGGGGAAAEGGAAGAGAGAAGAGEAGAIGAEGAAGAVGSAVTRGVSGAGAATESGIAGAGTMAGYEAMQRGAYGDREQRQETQPSDPGLGGGQGGGGSGSTPTSSDPGFGREQAENRPGNDDVWGEDQDPWGGGGPPSAGGDAGGGGGGWLDSVSDFFSD